jgi:hypothetical protein
MPKIQLTIKTSYLPGWSLYEGLRELIQNARDAEIEHNAPLTVDWVNDTLRIENEGTTLPTKALLLGHTTKLGNSDMIGKFGEGLKLGILALVRDGYSVKIRNGSEVWEPKIETSDVFDGEEILSFHIQGGREDKNRIRIEVKGVSQQTWLDYRQRFLFLNPPSETECIKTSYGTLLLGPKYVGKIFIKGIFVQNARDVTFGYDLYNADLDRDRKMVESWSLHYTTRQVFAAALNKNPDLFNKFYQLLDENQAEAKNLDSNSTYIFNEKTLELTMQEFFARHGQDAIPVANLDQSRAVEHLGKRGVVVSTALGAVLQTQLGTLDAQLKSLNNEVSERHSWTDLTSEEQNNLADAILSVSEVESVTLGDVDVVSFRSKTLLGQYTDGRILLSRKALASHEDTLATVIHEVAHRKGEDAEYSHIRELERIWTGVYRNLRARCR